MKKPTTIKKDSQQLKMVMTSEKNDWQRLKKPKQLKKDSQQFKKVATSKKVNSGKSKNDSQKLKIESL